MPYKKHLTNKLKEGHGTRYLTRLEVTLNKSIRGCWSWRK